MWLVAGILMAVGSITLTVGRNITDRDSNWIKE